MKDLFSGPRLIGISLARPLYSYYHPYHISTTFVGFPVWDPDYSPFMLRNTSDAQKRIYGTRQGLIWSHG